MEKKVYGTKYTNIKPLDFKVCNADAEFENGNKMVITDRTTKIELYNHCKHIQDKYFVAYHDMELLRELIIKDHYSSIESTIS